MSFTCCQCPRACGALRGKAGNGACGLGESLRIARTSLHFWEEPCLSGSKGSGTIFFSGCALNCVYCQNYRISQGGWGKDISVSYLRKIFESLILQGAHNINLVNPTHFSHKILEALSAEKLPIPVIYNSGGYDSVHTLNKFNGLIDIYLPDFKYASSVLSKRLSGVSDYFEVASQAVMEMYRQQPRTEFSKDGILLKGLLIRHLILPGQTEQSMRVLSYCKKHYPDALFSIMSQYTPAGAADEIVTLRRHVKEWEIEQIANFAADLELEGYLQDSASAICDYIPSFDL